MAKPKQFHVVAEGVGDRAVAHYLTAAAGEDEARELVQATEFALWMASRRPDDQPHATGREDQERPFEVTSVEVT